MNMLVKMADQQEIEKLGQQFQQLDKDKTGMLNAWELRAAIVESDLNLTNDQIDQIIAEVDYFGNNKINYSEFLMATLDVQLFMDNNKLQAIFNQFDTDGSGSITQENIVTAMNKIGHVITQEDLDKIMAQHDIQKNKVITFIEFKAMFLDLEDLELATTHKFKGGTNS